MPLNALMPLNGGAIFAGFRIVRSLGSGGMGEVYLIQHPRLPRRNALKILSANLSADPDYRARFNREANLASTLYHPHIVGVHDRGEYNGQLWLSMDFVDGQDAGRLLASRYPAGMPVDMVLSIITAVASALDDAHRQGLLHRDVKPANIMLTHDDGEQRILLTDFGIARSVDDISGLTSTNMSVGTVAYSAPEQLMGEEIDGRADQYALAATAYHLLTGLQLFAHSNQAVAISRHLNAAPPVLADTRPELPLSTRCLLRRWRKIPISGSRAAPTSRVPSLTRYHQPAWPFRLRPPLRPHFRWRGLHRSTRSRRTQAQKRCPHTTHQKSQTIPPPSAPPTHPHTKRWSPLGKTPSRRPTRLSCRRHQDRRCTGAQVKLRSSRSLRRSVRHPPRSR